MLLRGVLVAGLLLLPVSAGVAEDPAVSPDEIRGAVTRSLPLLAQSAQEFTKHRECFSCHHQTMSVLAMRAAQAKGLLSTPDDLQAQIDWTTQFLQKNEQRFREGKGTGGQVDTAGYALWALAAASHPPNSSAAAVVEYLLVRNQDRDHWIPVTKRPPTEASDFTTTFVSIQGLLRYGTSEQQPRAMKRVEQARTWLLNTPAGDTEDHVFRLRALKAAGADEAQVQEAAKHLLARQRDDGGWSQLAEAESDAYATGSALAALVDTGTLAAGSPPHAKGVRYLLNKQLPDGSWHVVTRSKPIQLYFETGFPHGADQFISMAATCWSIVALCHALPEPPSP